MICKFRFGHTPTDFWAGRDTDTLTELCHVNFTAPDAQTAIDVAESLAQKVIDGKGLDVVWLGWQELYLWKNPFVPEHHSGILRERYSQPTLFKKGRYYAFLSTNEHTEKNDLPESLTTPV